MKLSQIRGNTWCLSDWQMIPLYRVDETQAILIDSGISSQREAMEAVLAENGIRICGILGTHTHLDHGGNHAYFQKKYQAPVILPAGEAGIASSDLSLKLLLFSFSPERIYDYPTVAAMRVDADRVILPAEPTVEVCGCRFEVLQTPGHTASHVAYVTPDGVLCAGDAVLTKEALDHMKLSYNFSVKHTIESMEALCARSYTACIFSHRKADDGMRLKEHVSYYRTCLLDKAEEIRSLISEPMQMSRIRQLACEKFSFYTKDLLKADIYLRTIRGYVEYLVDTGQVNCFVENGLEMYERTGQG